MPIPAPFRRSAGAAVVYFALCGGLFGTALGAQCPPGAPMPQDLATLSATPAIGSAAEVRWNLGKKAITAGDHDTAQKHLLAALELHPSSPAILLDLVRAAGDNRDQQLLWGERYVRAATSERGRFKLDAAAKKSVPPGAELAVAHKLAQSRAQAIAEVARFASRQRPSGKSNAPRAMLAAFASELLLTLGDGAPLPLAAAAPQVRAIAESIGPDYDDIFQGLVRIMRRTPAGDEDPALVREQAIAAARILTGLSRQSTFKDLQGPEPPDLGAIGSQARDLLAGIDRSVQGEAKVWTIAELEALSPEQREAFTDAHDTWQHPGVAVSPTGRYRVETICGHGTLLGTANTVELHHARLVSHYGKDPFAERQGIVRIVPEDSDLETEGVPFWWAAGFQSGDRTTIRFAWGDIPSLGHTLTHELTHRFDGVLRPFLQAWYVEGHAVWTGGHYGRMAETDFTADYLQRGAVDATWRKDYGSRAEFEKLLTGTIEEYRDNYQAGYALYAYLRSYPPKQKPLFGDVLGKFEKNARGGQRDPVGYFEKTFCDGKAGRPGTLDDFLEGYQGFLGGVGRWLADQRNDDNRWVELYGKIEGADRPEKVMDRPTWSWARNRAEPFFGQDHAARAVRLLHEVAQREASLHGAAVAAGLWSITVDGWRPDNAFPVAASARQTQQASAAQAFAILARTRFPGIPSSDATPLAAQLPRTAAFVLALAERANALVTSGAMVAAAAVAQDHDELARRLDLPVLDLGKLGAPPAVPTHLGGHGWTESGLTSFDQRRVTGLWYATPGGDLHVGREKPRDGTGTVDRRAHQRDAFAHTVSWQAPGAYVLRGRVHFTTSYVRGAIVFGHSRRDRDIRLHFTSGDFNYAVGREETNRRFDRIRFRLEGLWERDGELPSTLRVPVIRVSDDKAWFDYELEVRGPRVAIRINDEEPFTYAVHDGAPIEGQVGFAMAMGAIRVQEPTVQRLAITTGGALTGALTGAMIGLDFALQPTVPLEELLDLPTRGITPAANGMLVLWIPAHQEDVIAMALPRAIPVLTKILQAVHEHPQPWILAVPKAMTAEQRRGVESQLQAVRREPMPILEHEIGEPFTGTYPWVLFIDGLGVLRAAADVADVHFHTKVQKWSRMFRPR